MAHFSIEHWSRIGNYKDCEKSGIQQKVFRPAGFQRKKFKTLDNLLSPLRKMNVDINEFAAAKTIFFMNPGKKFELNFFLKK